MSVETVLAYALCIIGVLLTMLIGLVVYVFQALRNQVQSVASDVNSLTRNRVKLMHKDDCRTNTQHLQEQLDDHQEQLVELTTRVTRAETLLQLDKEHG